MGAAVLIGVPVGLAAGSVAGAALTRWPAGVTLGRPPRSRCDSCAAPVALPALVPVLGWLVHRGRCRICGGAVALGQTALELVGVGAVVLALAGGPPGVGVLLAAVGVVLALAAALDVAHRWIPDRLTLPSAAVVVPAALALAVVGPARTDHVLLFGLGVPAALSALRRATIGGPRGPWLGGGDVKLLVPVLAAAALVPGGPGGVAVGAVAAGGAVATVGLLTGRVRIGTRVPLAPFLAVGWTGMLVLRLVGVSA